MKASEIRQKWLDFFEEKQHKIEESASLVPHNDPTLLWINAGMAPLKSYFDGRVIPENPRIANAQKCIRTNDIENVGKTKRHQTFFEMLGNFSIGDYFKEEAIVWAWEFLTDKKWIGFDKELLHVTIHPEDDEAYAFWNEKVGLPRERIIKLEDNFWDIGEGPCGPCTEIFYDRGPSYGNLSDPECTPGGENERFLEVWNLVFSQFNHNKDGSYTPLPNKNIDTGAGLERFASILQNVDSNFDTDLFSPILMKTCDISKTTYREDEEKDIALKVIADHVRTVVFAVGDGVFPSNEGRGYVIRRLLRRAVRYGLVLGIDQPFLYQLVAVVSDIMGSYYKEISEKQAFIEKVIRNEEERFHETLSEGLAILSQMSEEARRSGGSEIGGFHAFKLYDTYGFPLDLTEDYAAENGLTVDREGFNTAMEEQRNRARAARQDSDSMQTQGGPLGGFTSKSEFVGYTDLIINTSVIAILINNQYVDQAREGERCQVLLDQTPFYAESGGQVSDQGTVSNDQMKGLVEGVGKAPHGQHVHQVYVESGILRKGDPLIASIISELRNDTIKNHTATHLLHKALKETLGDHVNQAGSLVSPERLRFDFSHFSSLQHVELVKIEQRVNQQIWENISLNIETKALSDAKAMGATALFGEKYGDVVRVVQIGDYSLELCGGCHVSQTGQIGLFKIVSETGIGSGIRRIEALTGRAAVEQMNQQIDLLQQGSILLKIGIQDVPKRIEALLSQLKELNRDNESLRGKLSRLEAGSLSNEMKMVGDIPLLAAKVDAGDMDTLRNMVDQMKNELKSAVIILGAISGDRVNLVTAVTPDLIKKGFHAGQIIKEIAAQCGGNGGGRPDLAQAGGKNPAGLREALRTTEALIMKISSRKEGFTS